MHMILVGVIEAMENVVSGGSKNVNQTERR